MADRYNKFKISLDLEVAYKDAALVKRYGTCYRAVLSYRYLQFFSGNAYRLTFSEQRLEIKVNRLRTAETATLLVDLSAEPDSVPYWTIGAHTLKLLPCLVLP